MKSVLILILFFMCQILLSSAVYAQENAANVIENFRQAVGLKNEIERVKNLYALAACQGPKEKYTTEIHSATERRTIFKQTTEKGEVYLGQTNGNVYWTKDADFELASAKAAFVWRSHEFQWIALHLSERFHEPKFVGYADFAGQKTIKLSALDELGRPAELFFDEQTKLLRGFTILDPFSEKPETIRLVFNEWKRIESLFLPIKITATDKQGDFVLNFHTIKINQIDEKIFEIPPKVSAIKELFEIHRLQRTAHFERNAKLLVSLQADDFVEISDGRIGFPKKEELIKRFQSYFDASTFIEWDDIKPPIIKISDDATLAYMIVNKRVRRKTQDGLEETAVFAWTSTFQKLNGKWLMTSIASTDVPPSVTRQIPFGKIVSVDGKTDAKEWAEAATVEIKIEKDWTVTVYFKQDAENLYFRFANLKIAEKKELYPEVLIDTKNAKTKFWEKNQWWFHSSYSNCEGEGLFNNYKSCRKGAKNGWNGNNFPLSIGGDVEILISKNLLSVKPGDSIGLAFDVTDTSKKWFFYPESATLESPETWASFKL